MFCAASCARFCKIGTRSGCSSPRCCRAKCWAWRSRGSAWLVSPRCRESAARPLSKLASSAALRPACAPCEGPWRDLKGLLVEQLSAGIITQGTLEIGQTLHLGRPARGVHPQSARRTLSMFIFSNGSAVLNCPCGVHRRQEVEALANWIGFRPRPWRPDPHLPAERLRFFRPSCARTGWLGG